MNTDPKKLASDCRNEHKILPFPQTVEEAAGSLMGPEGEIIRQLLGESFCKSYVAPLLKDSSVFKDFESERDALLKTY